MRSIEEIDKSISFADIANSYVFESKNFFSSLEKIIIAIRKFLLKMSIDGKKIMLDIKSTVKRIGLSGKLQAIKFGLNKAKKDGKNYVEMVNYEKFVNYYCTNADRLESAIKRCANETKFKSKDDYQRKVDKLEREITDFKTKLEDIFQHKEKVPIEKAIKCVEKEIKGDSAIYKTYLGCLYDLEKAMITLEKTAKSQEIVTDNYLREHHMGAVRRLISKFAQTIRNLFSKFIRAIVFFFA